MGASLLSDCHKALGDEQREFQDGADFEANAMLACNMLD